MGKPEYKKYRNNMNICITAEQHKEIVKRADKNESSIAEYVRDIVFPK